MTQKTSQPSSPLPQPGAPAARHPWIDAFGAAVRAARAKKELSQAETARQLGMTAEVYSRIERGLLVPSVKRLHQLCQILEISPDALLVLEHGTPPPSFRRWRKATTELPDSPALRGLLRKVRQLSPEQLRRLNQITALIFE